MHNDVVGLPIPFFASLSLIFYSSRQIGSWYVSLSTTLYFVTVGAILSLFLSFFIYDTSSYITYIFACIIVNGLRVEMGAHLHTSAIPECSYHAGDHRALISSYAYLPVYRH